MTPWTIARQAATVRDSPGKNPGVGCHFLLQGIFLTQGSNPRQRHWRADSFPLSHRGSPASQFTGGEIEAQRGESGRTTSLLGSTTSWTQSWRPLAPRGVPGNGVLTERGAASVGASWGLSLFTGFRPKRSQRAPARWGHTALGEAQLRFLRGGPCRRAQRPSPQGCTE